MSAEAPCVPRPPLALGSLTDPLTQRIRERLEEPSPLSGEEPEVEPSARDRKFDALDRELSECLARDAGRALCGSAGLADEAARAVAAPALRD